MPELTSNEPNAAPPTGAGATSGATPSTSPPPGQGTGTTAPASSPSSSPTTVPPSGDPPKPAEKPAEPPAPKTGETPPKDGEKPKAEAVPPPAPTAAYDSLEIPPQVDPASPALGEFKELAARAKLPPAVAQELVQFYANQLQATVEAQAAARAAQDAAWVKEVKQDPEIGHLQWPHTARAIGKLKEAMPTVNAAITVLEQHGLGNQPALVRAFRDLGFAFIEDKLVVAGSSAGKANPYPNTPGMRD